MIALDLPTILAVAAMLLLAWDASRADRNPLVILAGFAILGAAVICRLFGGAGVVATLAGFLADAGVAFLAASLLMAVRRARAFPFLILGVMALILAAVLFSGMRLVRAGEPEAEATGSLIVELGPDDRIDEIREILRRFGIRFEPAFPSVSLQADEDLAQMYILTGPEAALQDVSVQLRQDRENVDHVEWNRTVTLPEPPASVHAPMAERSRPLANDPLLGSQWAMAAIRGHEAHALLRTLSPRRKALVAILDTGVDAEHADLKSAFHASPSTTDLVGHGTHCAGIAGAPANNGIGVASLNWEGRFVEIASFQALPNGRAGTYEDIAQALIDATQAHTDVISMSLGDYTPIPPRVVSEAVDFAQRQGIIIVASAGNGNQDAIQHMPSNLPGVLAVAAVDPQLRKARFSNTIDRLSRPIAAPGVDVLSLKPGGEYVSLSGTSMAAPLVAGLIGVLLSLEPDLTADQVYGILHETGIQGEDAASTGRTINAEAAIRAVLPGT